MTYLITKPLSDLPPLSVKTFKVTSAKTIDFINQYNSVCVSLTLHNHAGATSSYRINDSSDTLDLKATTGIEEFFNVIIEKIDIITVSDVDIIATLAPISLLKRFEALEVG